MANVIKHKRGSGSDPGASDLILGELAIRTDTGRLFTKMDSGAIAEIAGGGSDIAINTLSSSSGTGGGSATFNGSAYRFTLSAPPSVSAQQLLVSINGVIQKPVAGTGQPSEGFSIDGNDIILGDAPATGSDFFILTFKSLGVSEPADNSVTSAKIADGAIVNADINASAAIAGSKISPDFGSQGIATTANIASNADNSEFRCGTNADFKISHTGSENILRGDSPTVLRNAANNETLAKFTPNGAVELYHDNTKRFETGSLGVRFFGNLYADDNEKLLLGNSQDLQIYHDGSHSRIVDSGTGNLILQTSKLNINNADGSEALIHATENGKIELYHDNSVKFETTSTGATVIGSLGIGTTSPVNPLHVVLAGTDIATFESTDAGSSGAQVSFKHTSASPADNDTIANLTFDGRDDGNNATTYAQLRVLATDVSNTDESGAFQFFTRNVGTFAERMRIDSSGRVGINQTSFATSDTMLSISELTGHLEVGLLSKNDSACVLNFGDPEDYNIGRLKYAHDDNSMRFDVNASERMRIDSSGNLLLGTTSASGGSDPILHINQASNTQIYIGNTATSASGACGLVFAPSNNITGSMIECLAEEDFSQSANQTAGLKFTTRRNGTLHERMRVNSSGNVGIGTTSPRSLLDLGAGSGDGSLSSTLSQYQIMLEAPQGTGDYGRNIGWSVGNNGLTAAINAVDVGGSDATGLAFITGTNSAVAERMRIDSSGKVGIGTSSPERQLHIVGNDGATGATLGNSDTCLVLDNQQGNGTIMEFLSDNDGAGRIMFTDTDASNRGKIQYFHNNDFFQIEVATSSQSTMALHLTKQNAANNVQSDMIAFDVGGSGRGKIVSAHSGSSSPQFSSYSDRRLKTNIKDYTGGYEKIKSLKIRIYDEISNDDTKSIIGDIPAKNVIGYIADEFQEVFPQEVRGTKDEIDSDGKPVYQSISDTFLTPYLVQALQEAVGKIETLETKVAALEAK